MSYLRYYGVDILRNRKDVLSKMYTYTKIIKAQYYSRPMDAHRWERGQGT